LLVIAVARTFATGSAESSAVLSGFLRSKESRRTPVSPPVTTKSRIRRKFDEPRPNVAGARWHSTQSRARAVVVCVW
jgi:hypothetical protein